MKGYEITFMAPRSRRHRGEPVLDAVVRIARTQGITRYTRRIDSESVGAGERAHSAHFFELADEPEEVTFILADGKSDTLMQQVEAEGLHVFCVRQAIEYFQLGADPAATSGASSR